MIRPKDGLGLNYFWGSVGLVIIRVFLKIKILSSIFLVHINFKQMTQFAIFEATYT